MSLSDVLPLPAPPARISTPAAPLAARLPLAHVSPCLNEPMRFIVPKLGRTPPNQGEGAAVTPIPVPVGGGGGGSRDVDADTRGSGGVGWDGIGADRMWDDLCITAASANTVSAAATACIASTPAIAFSAAASCAIFGSSAPSALSVAAFCIESLCARDAVAATFAASAAQEEPYGGAVVVVKTGFTGSGGGGPDGSGGSGGGPGGGGGGVIRANGVLNASTTSLGICAGGGIATTSIGTCTPSDAAREARFNSSTFKSSRRPNGVDSINP